MDCMDSVDTMDSVDRMDSTKRLIRIKIQKKQFVFGHQSGRSKRSAGLSTANIRDFSAPIFSDWSQEAYIYIYIHIYIYKYVFLQFCSRTGGDEVGVGTGLGCGRVGWRRVGWRRVGRRRVGLEWGWERGWGGLYNYFKAAICLMGYFRQGLSNLLP